MSTQEDKKRENLPWVEKYRPQTLDDVYGQTSIVTTVRKFIEEGKLPHLLFYGPPGTGKTSTIVALARELYGKNYSNMVLELNASDDRGIDVVRNQIKDFASTRQIFSRGFKLIILDEADAMTNAAQNALRRIIEKYTKNTRFCILANYAHKLTPALLSRCTRFRFQPLPSDAIERRIANVLVHEHIKLSDQARAALLKLSKGDMRRVLNVLQASKATLDNPDKDEITDETIYECCGAPRPADVTAILKSILEDDWSSAYYTLNTIRQTNGLALIDLIEGMIEILEEYELQNETTRIELLTKLGDIEYSISKGGNDRIQSSAVIGAIKTSFENEVQTN
ncbi:similar to Saccharomyces cerevisiae YNL290W RFC3 Subunit of heteropentameric Replication factor C (RF-C) [Maudiozyma barnettii]|uniref:Similar to Saccharomyces cerevisiae YNL290W RFC3 Subunit of heteropentameric Replication factor C (RF-C) n=1 Tax=Maudiozyma barnettii TaxID=61262 RepID=A0A8H2VEG4_9SACH|nr:replication factor C subunit 3 [Kazachstania barnettii]CAB4253566.1 similar to Saccharomyces cerevisiae YNL290W RFC3 Subunit of heteropentameric Replication factor C (RF-C) [Kazachstania barnettii]CAD1781240.1 similar to Saccharomyces cerevisiae YNL290W RFC3 Subunit of heteropentameric Replication factor C (RF-C) [Kazachstania barnettii]